MSEKGSFLDGISPFTLTLILLVLMVIGVALVPLIDVTSSPRPVQGKVLRITYWWNNASAMVIEQNVTSCIEGVVAAVNGVESTESVSYFGYGEIKINLKKNVDVSAVKFEISSLLRQIKKKLPEECTYPFLSGGEVVNENNRKDVQKHLLTYRVNANLKDEQIHEYFEQNIKNRILSIDGISNVSLTGGNAQYLEVSYDPMLLSEYDIHVSDIEEAIKNFIGKNSIVGEVVHDVDAERQRIALHLSSLPFKKDIGEIPMKSVNGEIIYLNNLAKYSYKERQPDNYYRVNGLNSVYINIYAATDVNLISLSNNVQKNIENLKKELRDGVYLTLTYDVSKEKKSELEKLVTRTILSLVILLLFVWIVSHSLKYLSVITVTLVANILLAIIAYYLFDIRLHTIALAGITVSLGLIIDSSIVMVDHYSYYRNRKVFISIMAALLTTIGSLVLIFFMPEYIRRDLYDFAWIIIINLTVALLTALFFVPALVTQFDYSQRKRYINIRNSKTFIAWTRFYRKYVNFTQNHKWVYYILLLLAFGIPFHAIPVKLGDKKDHYLQKYEQKWYEIVYEKTLGSNFFQYELKDVLSTVFGGSMRLFVSSLSANTFSEKDDEIVLNIRARMPLGGSAYELNEKVMKLENFLADFKEIERFETNINGGEANIKVKFYEEYRKTSFPYILENKVIGQILNIGGADWATSGVSERGFSNSLNLQHRTNNIEIAGYNYTKLYRYAEDICRELRSNHRVTDIIIESPGYGNEEDEVYVEYNKENIALYDVNLKVLYNELSELLSEKELGYYNNNGVNVPLNLKSLQREEFDLWTMKNSYINVQNASVFLPDIIKIDMRKARNRIAKKNQEYVLRVAFNVLGSYSYASKYIKSVTEKLNEELPIGYRCLNKSYGWYDDDSTQYWLILVIIVIIFFICSILFESLRQPFVIITLIPVSFIGTFLTFYFTGVEFGTGGFASLVLLCGIVVNAGIYIMTEYNVIYKKALRSGVRFDLVNIYVKAYNHKIIPIFLTVISTVLGLVPFFIDGNEERFWFSFAVGTIGGLLFSLIALVFVMPVFMSLKVNNR